MISTEMLYGQGLGNQLSCYVSTRVIALDKNFKFGIYDPNNCLGDKRYTKKGLYFMDLDLGENVVYENIKHFYTEMEYRYKTNTCHHDYTHGCWVNITDNNLKNVSDDTHILGIMQGTDYFYHRINIIKKWLKVKEEYDNYNFSNDDICVLNVRGYLGSEVYLPKTYWINAINHMLKINSYMKFIVITEDINLTKQLLPELSANTFHFGVGEDYSIIKNAKYLILSNSSFSIFPSLTSDTLKYTIAPKYMARYNYSDGYWSQGYNIYPTYTYMDRDGNLFSYEECLKELDEYDRKNYFYEKKVIKYNPKFPDVSIIKPN